MTAGTAQTTTAAPRSARRSLDRGGDVIRREAARLPASPGVYRMLAGDDEVLYVGKASDLQRRVTSYTRINRLPIRLQRMVAETRRLEIVTTHTEVEALLLEANLIKRYRPRYNVLLRDDKSFPYLHLTGTRPAAAEVRPGAPQDPANWPYVIKHRGPRDGPGVYFGPFASAGAVNRTLNALERAFLLRSCSDGVFANRRRPCLKYQLKRCSGPCVGLISAAEYEKLLADARDFLSGRSAAIQARLAEQMEAASERLDFEAAARLRDRIRALTQVQAHQDINLEIDALDDADVIAAHMEGGQTCVQVFFFRGGRNNGNRAYYPRHDKNQELPDVLAAFIGQFYEDKLPPRLVLTSHVPAERTLLVEALGVRAGRKVTLACPRRGAKAKLVRHAVDNARQALARRLAEHRSHAANLEGLAELFELPAPPARIEVYDNSHVGGSHAIGAMIVAGPDGFDKKAYRKFNIKDVANDAAAGQGRGAAEAGRGYRVGGAAVPATPGDGDGAAVTPGDDYAMMRQVLRRRFARLAKARGAAVDGVGDGDGPDDGAASHAAPSQSTAEAAPESTSETTSETTAETTSETTAETTPETTAALRTGSMAGATPDLVIVDGGPGQLGIACAVLAELDLGDIPVIGIAKGPQRTAGRERIYLPGRRPIELAPRDPRLYFLQRLRDEAHRFAIGGHRARRSKAISQSRLDDIPGIGAKRKKALLAHFGSARSVAAAGLADLAAVDGISDAVARTIYDYFHSDR